MEGRRQRFEAEAAFLSKAFVLLTRTTFQSLEARSLDPEEADAGLRRSSLPRDLISFTSCLNT
jgi:hypothetical protein